MFLEKLLENVVCIYVVCTNVVFYVRVAYNLSLTIFLGETSRGAIG